jgi:peptidoglycan hydrolase-like protein with peptidoglycan-binding domain
LLANSRNLVMPRTISGSVGRLGKNLSPDVKIVQELLNNVPADSGGPLPLLAVDGIAGPKTNSAIQKFQQRQIGFSGADGRVDPNGPTLKKLNEFDTSPAPIPPAPVPTVPPLTVASLLLCPHGGSVRGFPTSTTPDPTTGLVPLKATDPFIVVGCPLPAPFPSPCVTVRWIFTTKLELDITSQGICMSASGVPQGPVVIARA